MDSLEAPKLPSFIEAIILSPSSAVPVRRYAREALIFSISPSLRTSFRQTLRDISLFHQDSMFLGRWSRGNFITSFSIVIWLFTASARFFHSPTLKRIAHCRLAISFYPS